VIVGIIVGQLHRVYSMRKDAYKLWGASELTQSIFVMIGKAGGGVSLVGGVW